MNRKYGTSFVFVVFLIVGVIFTQPAYSQPQNVNSGNVYKVPITVEFSEADLIFDKIEGYDIVHLFDGDKNVKLGNPLLPSKLVKVALPEGMIAVNVVVDKAESQKIDGEYNIYPSQPAREISSNYDRDIEFVEPNSAIYSSDKPYPTKLAELIYQTDLAGQSMAVIMINPLQYIPAEKSLVFHTEISFTIQGDFGNVCSHYLPAAVSEFNKREYESMVKGMVINPEDAKVITSEYTPFQIALDPGNYDYVIITISSFVSAFQSLADWKTKKGIPAKIVTTTWIYGEYSGSNVEKIRAFIMDAHSTWGTVYFLLGGDTGQIPYHIKSVNGENVPNDTYYSDYDGNWTCNVHVGRASVISSGAVTTFKNKVLTYEKNPPLTSYCEKIGLYAFDLDDYTFSEILKRKLYTSPYNYIPSGWAIDTVYDSQSTNHRTAVINSINSGQNLINHSDHSYTYYMGTGSHNHGWGLNTGDVDAFSNGSRQSILYSLGCWACSYDYSSCIAEHFVRDSNGGCVAFIGNSRSGLYYQGDYNTLSMLYDRYFFRSLLSQGQYKLGNAFSDHKNDGPTSYGAEQQIFTELTLLGDPEMPVWTDTPVNLIVSHPDTIPLGSNPFTVHVQSFGGANIYLGYVCLMKGDEVYLTGSTDINGDVTFYPAPTTLGTMYVTATKNNYLPSETEAVVDEFYGAISGIVKNQLYEPIEGVYAYSSSPSIEDTTDATGMYTLYGFDSGSYSVTYSHPGYQDTTITGISVIEGDTTRVHVTLNSLPYDAGVSEIFSPTDSMIMDMPILIRCEVNNYGSETQSFGVIFEARILGSSAIEFADTVSLSNVPGYATDTVSGFDTFYPSVDTIYNLKAYTNLSADMNYANDTTLKSSDCFQGAAIWYGNLDGSPLTANVNSRLNIDVWMLAAGEVYIGDMLLCLGAENTCFDSLLSQTEGQLYYPLTEWDAAEFLSPDGSPPNPAGWSNQAFMGFARLSSESDAPWLHQETASKIMTFTFKTVDDDSLIGQTVACLGMGINSPQGETNIGDTLGWYGFPYVEYFSSVTFIDPFGYCDYLPGDVNGDDIVIGSDVTYAVNYFRGTGNPPPDSCWNTSNESWLYSAADVNGDCLFMGSDVVYFVQYFRGVNPPPTYCPETPPTPSALFNDDISVFPDGSIK
ncbi:MAG: carboxypeptidase regulatory-like domain-containing protein [candidate division Zixibacteria bacterium]|nr:carboxypeptidase regulatory-like domain-containing protein [candidate division Zixibacteria bacterium]